MDLKRLGNLNLARALRIQSAGRPPSYRNLRVAFTGAGGKTTALFQLARQLPPPVLVSASTHLAVSQIALADSHLIIRTSTELEALESQHFQGVVLITGPDDGAGRCVGVDESVMDSLHILAGSSGVPLLVEADGSRRLPLKAPAEHEPAIPPFTNQVVVVAGMSGVGRKLDEDSVHRPERFADLSGLGIGEQVNDLSVVRVLLHPLGGLKGIPKGARRSILLNQVDHPEQDDQANRMAGKLLEGYSSVLVASLGTTPPRINSVHEKTAGVILAAGGSSRLGVPKQLLSWHGIPFVRHVAMKALSAGLAPVIVVSGAFAPEVDAALQGLEVQLAHNPSWEQGQSTSVITGVKAVPPENGSAIFLLSDQPQVMGILLQDLVLAHARSLAPIVAPRVQGKRANPALFDARVFSELLTLTGDTGGRKLFDEPGRFPVYWVDWDDASLLVDVDTPQDYQRLLSLELNP
jgi:molybdenum cofactor cytidylyltransferase